LAVAGCAAIAIAFLWQAARWQNSVRSLMGLDPVETAEPLKLALIALFVFAVVIALARLFRMTFAFLSRKFEHVTPKPIARFLGILLALTLFWSIADGLLLKAGLRLADSSFRELDALIDSDLAPPAGPLKTGSAASLVSWHDLGFRGREFVASGPTAEKIGAFLHQPALEPIRVYVGLNAAETAKERAALALAELKRTGAFERSTLIVVVPTGTGWVDPAAMDTVEYLHRGDVASVALQYSYLTSWLSLLVEPNYGAEAGEALFKAVYGYWTTMPKDKRPKLYLHGLSLGALNSERSADLFDVIGDPFQGALWSGPPFESAGWKSVTAGREPGSPAWLPRFRDSSVIRFTAQKNALDIPGAKWGPMQQPQRVDRHQHGGAGIGQDRRPQPGDAGDGGHQEHRLQTERDGDVLADIAHRAPATADHRTTSPTRPCSIAASAVSSATSVPPPMAMPISAAASAGASLMPSPTLATTAPRASIRRRCAACPPASVRRAPRCRAEAPIASAVRRCRRSA
jgi:uncharacterized membrane protein